MVTDDRAFRSPPAPQPNAAPHLAWFGGSQGVDLTPDDFEAMDVALSVVPELRLVALAIVRARRLGLTYPLTSPAHIEQLLEGEKELIAAGHLVNARRIRRYFAAPDFPIEHEGQLARAVFVALNRCIRHEQLRVEVDSFERELDRNFVQTEGGA